MLAGLIAILGILLFVGVYFGGLVLLNGWVLSKLWLWFMVPAFGLKPLNVIQAIGLALVVRFLTSNYVSNSNDRETTNAETAAKLLVPYFIALFALGFGYLVKLFL